MLKEFQSLDALLERLEQLGARNVYCKFLAENDNSKQQIYLGGSFEVLKQLVFGNVRADASLSVPNFKASVPLSWVDGDGQVAPAPGAQLILYPQYPEVRLSGFLKGCPLAPSAYLRPIPKAERQFNNGPDGRVLFFGVSDDEVFTYLADGGSTVASAIRDHLVDETPLDAGTLRKVRLRKGPSSKDLLLARLREIQNLGPHESMRLNRSGERMPYAAKNGGGYTLEALFDIIPNGRSAPDFMGWELKAFSGSRITLMTPEPDAGYYGEHGVEAFLRKYGRQLPDDKIYFTGSHKANIPSPTSGQTLVTVGFDSDSGKITDVTGGIRLLDGDGEVSAEWTFARLVEQWGRKHAAAAYVPYKVLDDSPIRYDYQNPILLGEGTEFSLFLKALMDKKVIYDPAPKLERASEANSKTKARSQFRMGVKDLGCLYRKFDAVKL
ncbi:hypothetical protein PAQ31011_00646 [Pandoraea aquatica]|uniref:MvaI/BcnI restriction endonuclease domain-containing protein n=1 Tax=Pandoraea aquatica TaxID=2508290 RepID=A0A5E4SBY6_9BURK|nr:MvaI/BcnI family restriction endonuclease [Pandoraea aquatica]VVD71748.1 hypothetical protein PAQ31011_00646 [Pandoraea aquatica]